MVEPSTGDVIDGRYEVEAVIGRGGMGSVWRARHVFTNVRVALKLLFDEYDAIAFERFLAEARAASTIGHPAIVVVSDANRMANNQLYLAMELLVGKPLRLAIHSGVVGSGDQIRRIGLEILDALGAAHKRGIIHRDLKPENIFLVAPGNSVKLLDFGIAKVLGGVAGRSTHTGGVLGTIEYMAPEQLADASDVDGRADLWALGVILYEMICGMRPFAGATPGEKLQSLINDEPMPIGDIVPVSNQVSTFFETALAKDRNRRFASAAAMSNAWRSLVLASGAAPSTGAGLTLGTGAGWVADSGHMPDPALGTGAGWQRPSANLPGPTLGTGAGKPATGDPYGHDNDRYARHGTVPPTSTGPGHDLGIPASIPPMDAYGLDNAPRSPAMPAAPSQPASIPPSGAPSSIAPSDPYADQFGRGDAPAPVTPVRSGRGRMVVFVVIGVGVICGAIALGIVMATGKSSSGGVADARHADDAVIARLPVDGADVKLADPVKTVDAGSCASHCERLAECKLALPSCVTDCNDAPNRECLAGAKNCDELAACYWARRCGRPIRRGGMSCLDGLQCSAQLTAQDTAVQCTNCFDLFAVEAATKLARFWVCNATLLHHTMEASRTKRAFDGQEWFATHCQPLSTACSGVKR